MSRSPAVPGASPAKIDRSCVGTDGPVERVLRALLCRPPIVMGAVVFIAAAIAGAFSLEVVRYNPDEIGYTHLAIGIKHSLSPITLSYGGEQRLNQLYPLLIAPIWGSFGNVTAFRITHVWNVLLMASAAIPTYLLAREVVQRQWAAYIAAALVALMPWMTLSLAELTEVAAFPACAWALLAMQRALSDPSPRRDAIALGAIALASYGRLQLLILAPAFVVAMLLHELGFAAAARGRRRAALREALGRIARGHAPLSAVGVVGVLVGVPLLLSGRLANAAGFYGNTLAGATLNGATFDLARSYLVFIGIGLGALPAALALGFVAESLLAPVSRAAHAFAALTIVTIIALTLQVAEVSVRFTGGVLQERYVFYIVPLLAVGMCAALLLARRPAITVLAGSAVLAALIASTHYQSVRTAFWYEVSPAMTGFYDWIRPAFEASSGPTADPGASNQVLAGVVVLAAGLCVAVLARRLSRPRVLTCVGVLAIVFCGVETVHAMSGVVHGNSSGKGYGSGTLQNVDWVDRGTPPDASVEQVVSNVGGSAQSRGLWEDSEFWNRSITGADTFGDVSDAYFATSTLRMEPRSGTVLLGGSRAEPAQRYLVTSARGFPIRFAGPVLAHSPDQTLELLRAATPLTAAWAVLGISSNGWLALDRPAIMRLYLLRGAPRRCVRVGLTLSLSSLSSSPRSLLLSGRRLRREVTFAPGETQTLDARVCGRMDAVPALTMLNGQGLATPDPELTLQLQRVTVTPA